MTAAAQQQGESQLTLRQGIWADAPTIFSAVLAEKMNPLVGLSPTRFLVAERRGSGGSGEVVGFGQTRPLQPGAVELLSLTVLPEHRQGCRWTVCDITCMDQSAALAVPRGAAACLRGELCSSLQPGIHQATVDPLNPAAARPRLARWCRGEGVGSALISALVAAAPAGHDIYLTTIGRRVALYERQGFQEVPQNEVPE